MSSDGVEGEPTNAEAYLDQMIRLLRNDGVRFPDDQVNEIRVHSIRLRMAILHAEGKLGG